MTMDLRSTDCKLASPTSLQLCINLVGAGMVSNWSVYSASGLDIYIDLGITLQSTAAAAAANATPREFEVDRPGHLSLAVSSSNLANNHSFPPQEQQLQFQAEHSACHTGAASGEELEENVQSICEPIETLDSYIDAHDDAVQLQQEERERESFAVKNCSRGRLELESDDCLCIKAHLRCPSNISSQIECFDVADVSAACHLLELSSYSGSVDSGGRELSSTETYDHESPKQNFCGCCSPAPEFEELTQPVDSLRGAVPGVRTTLSWMAGTKIHHMGNDASSFRKRRVRANLIKQTDVGQIYLDDWDFEIDVLDRPPSKRRNRRVDIIYKRSIHV